MLIDTHAHLAHKQLRPQVEDVLSRAKQAGVGRILVAVGDLDESKAALDLARQHEELYCLAGVHPHDAKDVAADSLRELQDLLGFDKCVAIGEIGLDYHYDFSPRDVQQRIFIEQLAEAKQLGCPVVIHTREAFDDTMSILTDSGVDGSKIVFHSFTGDATQAGRCLDLGATISYSGIATFKNAGDVRNAVRITPADRILVETDSPYLAPEPVRKMRPNEPANVAHVARFLADVRGVTFEDFARQTTQNAEHFFHMDRHARKQNGSP